MVSEQITGNDGDGRGFSWWGEASGFSAYLPPNTSQSDVTTACVNNGDNPPCIFTTVSSSGGNSSDDKVFVYGARSKHPGGVNVSMCDGSVTFVSDNILLSVWRDLSSSRGGEIISGSSL